MSNGRIAIVRSVGGLDGLDLHAGMWLALMNRGIVGDDLYGASAGAIATACDAANWDAGRFAKFVRETKDADLRDPQFAWAARLRWFCPVPGIWHGKKIRQLLAREFPETWEEMARNWRTIPNIYATRMADAAAVNVTAAGIARSPAEAIYASCAIPAVLPSYAGLDKHTYRDGGIRRAVPLPERLGDYEHVYVCIATGRRRAYADATDLVSQALSLLQQMFDGQILDVVERVSIMPNVTVLWPQPESNGGMLRFDHDLIDQAWKYTIDVLDDRCESAAGNARRRIRE
jgi:predicted acylesterase/phospholipase RssA